MNMTTVPSDKLKEMQQQLAEKDAEIVRMQTMREELLCGFKRYGAMIANHNTEIAAQELVIQQLRDALDELANLMEGVYIGAYTPDSFTNQPAKAALAIPTSTEHLEAWYKEMVGEPIAIVDDAGVLIVCNYSYKQGDKLHAIKPFKGGG